MRDITEVFDRIRQLQHTGAIVRAAHNRSLDSDSQRLWSKLEAQPIGFEQEIELPKTCKRSVRKTKLAVRFCPVNLRTPYRFDNRDPLLVYAVYATEIDCPEDETPIEWMLLTTEVIADIKNGFYDFTLVFLPLAGRRISQSFKIRVSSGTIQTCC